LAKEGMIKKIRNVRIIDFFIYKKIKLGY
jgi:hypothetical protein